MLWACDCGCAGIAHDLGFCPMCFKERDMPKITSAGPSNAAAPVEDVQETPVKDEPVKAPVKAPRAVKRAS